MKKCIIAAAFAMSTLFAAAQDVIQYGEKYTIKLTDGYNPAMEYAAVELGGRYAIGQCMIDTGCTGIYLTYGDYANCVKLGIISKSDFVDNVTNRTSQGKLIPGARYNMKVFKIGNALFRNIIVTFDMTGNATTRLVGQELFKNFKGYYTNLERKEIYLYK